MEVFKYLSEYDHVARFQRFMGVDIVEVNKLQTNGETKENANFADNFTGMREKNGTTESFLRERDVIVKNGAVHVNGKVHKVGSFKNGIHNPEVNETKLAYKINNKLIYYLMQFSAGLGSEIFYIVFFPFLCWNVDSRLTRQLCLVWYPLMYIGQFLKDCIRWPRPGPPAVRLEGKRFQLEYGMPSTHTIVGTCIPFSLLYLTSKYYEVKYTCLEIL